MQNRSNRDLTLLGQQTMTVLMMPFVPAQLLHARCQHPHMLIHSERDNYPVFSNIYHIYASVKLHVHPYNSKRYTMFAFSRL